MPATLFNHTPGQSWSSCHQLRDHKPCDEKAALGANCNEFSWICWPVNLIMADNNRHMTIEIIEKLQSQNGLLSFTDMLCQQQKL